jgi:hypothetical protein
VERVDSEARRSQITQWLATRCEVMSAPTGRLATAWRDGKFPLSRRLGAGRFEPKPLRLFDGLKVGSLGRPWQASPFFVFF